MTMVSKQAAKKAQKLFVRRMRMIGKLTKHCPKLHHNHKQSYQKERRHALSTRTKGIHIQIHSLNCIIEQVYLIRLVDKLTDWGAKVFVDCIEGLVRNEAPFVRVCTEKMG